MTLKTYQIDTFTDKLFQGNPAAVCPLENWLDDNTLQNIATENNLSETAFFVKEGQDYNIRWFTPTSEVDLCGHATLAASFVLFNHLNYNAESINFKSKSGVLTVRKSNNHYVLDFPTDKLKKVNLTEELLKPFTTKPIEAFKGNSDYLLVFETESSIKSMRPNISDLAKIKARGIIVTAKGSETDFVSRFFGPLVGVDEDPVTGSAHTSLIPYWFERLQKTELTAKQLSSRGGNLKCKYKGSRVEISGNAVTYLVGNIKL